MGIEIERKFLVKHELLPPLGTGQRIIQGYLSTRPSIRFRLLENKLIITIKEPLPDGTRFELETEKNNPAQDELLKLQEMALYPTIEKMRYRLVYDGLIWEIDIYQKENVGLITADIELPELNFLISFPDWIDSDSEVTNDPDYFNQNLGLRPFSSWLKKLE